MNREYHRWHSPALDRDMELLIFGHAGARVLVFPTSLGKYYEWEDRGMIGVLGEALERGWLQLYCVDSVDAESWYARRSHPGARAWRQVQYDNYLTHEVLPLMGQKNSNAFTMTAGASFGAYHAANYAFRHPDLIKRTLCFSGIYDIRQWADGYHDDNVYYNNPLEYLPNEHDPACASIAATPKARSRWSSRRWTTSSRTATCSTSRKACSRLRQEAPCHSVNSCSSCARAGRSRWRRS